MSYNKKADKVLRKLREGTESVRNDPSEANYRRAEREIEKAGGSSGISGNLVAIFTICVIALSLWGYYSYRQAQIPRWTGRYLEIEATVDIIVDENIIVIENRIKNLTQHNRYEVYYTYRDENMGLADDLGNYYEPSTGLMVYSDTTVRPDPGESSYAAQYFIGRLDPRATELTLYIARLADEGNIKIRIPLDAPDYVVTCYARRGSRFPCDQYFVR